MIIPIDSWSFPQICTNIKELFQTETARKVKTEKWQGVNVVDKPDMVTRELLNVIINFPLTHESLLHYRQVIQPNLPWADDHFEERVCGHPLNPGVQWRNWPWASSADKFRTTGDQEFNHTYMQRYWPKRAAGQDVGEPDLKGIRHTYGDMMDLVKLLAEQPYTRQAWIPIFFPEDTGIADGGRKPCSLGYQVIVREELAHIYYPLRSCDFVRHFRDDVYLTVRLLLWIIDNCRKLNPVWSKIKPGWFTMHMTSLHIFENDYIKLKGEGP